MENGGRQGSDFKLATTKPVNYSSSDSKATLRKLFHVMEIDMTSPMEKQDSWWLIKTLRSQVLSDLRKHIPDNYFSNIDERLRINTASRSAKHFDSEMQWGYKAATLGKKLFFDDSIIMTAREKSASEILMHLGMLATAEVFQKMTEEIAEKANEIGCDDGNASVVSKQVKSSHIPTFQDNLTAGLDRYLKHLNEGERAPFLVLLPQERASKIQKFLSWATNNIILKVGVPVLIALILAWLGLR